jgi:uncharacterized protein
MSADIDQLWQTASTGWQTATSHIHGIAHWRRVERNGILLCTRTGADVAVVRLFALFHDSCRWDDGHDAGHGARGAEYAASLRGTAFSLSDEQFTLLHEACTWHTRGTHHADPTIGTCWDADRLDLGRIGVIPNPEYMSTAFGKEIVAFGSIQPFLPKVAQ